MKVTLRSSSLIFGLFLWSFTAWAQPANDLCSGAIPLTIGVDEASAIRLTGDTRNTTDGALDEIPVCSANFYRDDVWYSLTAPSDPYLHGYSIRVDYAVSSTDIVDFGIALYYSCDADPANEPFYCGNNFAGDFINTCPLTPDQTIYIRVWSAAGDATNWADGAGTFKISAYNRVVDDNQNFTVLWGDQPGEGDFAGGLNGWTAEGYVCGGGADSANALWAWTESGLPTWLFDFNYARHVVSPIKSKTFCNGSMIFDSGLLDLGTTGNAGEGACPPDHEGVLISPVIDVSQFDVFGVSLIFNQSMQRWREGLHFIDYTTDGGGTWESIEINSDYTFLSTEPTTGKGLYNEQFRLRLPGVESASTLQFRFRFMGNYYWWIIDDVKLVETEANNLIAQENFFAIPPWATIPSDQVYPYFAENDILNNGAAPQSNVTLNHTIKDANTGQEIYNETLNYGTIGPDSLAENKIFPTPVVIPSFPGSYDGNYTVTQDQTDFDPADNMINFTFDVGGDYFAHETGINTNIAVDKTAYDEDAPLSWGYGNIFRPVVDVEVDRIQWASANPEEMLDLPVSLYLISWVDNNGDQIAQDIERKFVGTGEYTFNGTEIANELIETHLDNFESAGNPIIMKAGFNYIALLEYVANTSADPQFFISCSDQRDFRSTVLASDSAFVKGLGDHRIYMTALEFAPDGVLANIDIEVTDVSTTDMRTHFAENIVPAIRVMKSTTKTVDQLPTADLIKVYPNPATDNISVKLEFEKPYDNVKIRLMDNLGRMVYQKELTQTVTNHIQSIRTSEFAAGNYLLQVETAEGQRSVPVVIIK